MASSRANGRGGRPSMRTCIGCRRVAPAPELVRVVGDASGSLRIDRSGPGRGAWLCTGAVPGSPAEACLEQAAKRRAFPRALRMTIDPNAVVALRETVRERARIESGGAVSVAASRRD